MQPGQRVARVAGADACLDARCQDMPPVGDLPGRSQPLRKWRHAERGLQRIAGRHHQPDLIERKAPQRGACDVQMTRMGRVEGAAKDTDPHPPPVAPPRQRVARILVAGQDRSGSRQGRT